MKTDEEKTSSVKKHIIRLAAAAIIAAVLAFAYFSADDVKPPVDEGPSEADTVTSQTVTSAPQIQTESTTVTAVTSETVSSVTSLTSETATVSSRATDTSSAVTTETPKTTTLTVKTSGTTTSSVIKQNEKTCSFFISCATIFSTTNKVRDGVKDILPADGVIFPRTDVPIKDGDTVYDVLLRICKQNGIHIETTKIAATNSYYIEGIANLYEFDAGNLSGWMYSVDGHFPQTSTSMYKLNGGEKVEILYSCNIGVDVGDDYFNKAG